MREYLKFTFRDGVSAAVKAEIVKAPKSQRVMLYDEDLGEENKAPVLVSGARGGRKRPEESLAPFLIGWVNGTE